MIENQKQETLSLRSQLLDLQEASEQHHKLAKDTTLTKLSQINLQEQLLQTKRDMKVLVELLKASQWKINKFEYTFNNASFYLPEKGWNEIELRITNISYTASQLSVLYLSSLVPGYTTGSSGSSGTGLTFPTPALQSLLATLRVSCLLWEIHTHIVFNATSKDDGYYDQFIGPFLHQSGVSQCLEGMGMWVTKYCAVKGATSDHDALRVEVSGLSKDITNICDDLEGRVSSSSLITVHSLNELIDVNNLQGSHLSIFIQVYYYLHALRSIIAWLASWSSYHTASNDGQDTYSALFACLDVVYASLLQGVNYKKFASESDTSTTSTSASPWMVQIVTLRNALCTSLQLLIASSVNEEVESKGTIEATILRQLASHLREASLIAKDVCVSPSSPTSALTSWCSAEHMAAGDVYLYPDHLWSYITHAQDSTKPTAATYALYTELHLLPAYLTRIETIKRRVFELEASQQQIQELITQKRLLQSELELKKDELRTALNRLTEMQTHTYSGGSSGGSGAIHTSMTGSSTTQTITGDVSKLYDEVKVSITPACHLSNIYVSMPLY